MRCLEDWKELVMDWICPTKKSSVSLWMIGLAVFFGVLGAGYLLSQMSSRTKYRLKQTANSMMGDLRAMKSCMGHRCHH